MPLLAQILGSLLVLVSFVGSQMNRLATTSRLYLGLNTLGSLALALSATVEAQWGFLLLECAWLSVSALGLYRAFRHSAG
jgi:hypothetical protein